MNFSNSLQLNPESFETFKHLANLTKQSKKELVGNLKKLDYPEELHWLRSYEELFVNYQKEKQEVPEENEEFQIERPQEEKPFEKDDVINQLIQ